MKAKIPPIRIRFDGQARRAEVAYAVAELSLRVGIPLRLVDASQPPFNVIYGSPKANLDLPCIPFDSNCYDRATKCMSIRNQRLLWAPQGTPTDQVDLIGGIYRLLTLQDEAGVPDSERDQMGIFATGALPIARKCVATEPLVENHANEFLSLLQRSIPSIEQLPRWPGNSRYAVLLTHDTDALNLGSTPEIIFNAAKALLRRDPIRAQMFWSGWQVRGGPTKDNPLFGFSGWRNSTSCLGVRSAFYLYARGKVPRTLNDCRSDITDPGMDWPTLRSMAEDGWEFGLHPPIRAKESIDEFIWGKQFIEENLGRTVYGLRHHYWALDWRAPHLTYRKHVNAGFRYDLSMAWRDVAGLRPGTCLPFRPFDQGRGVALDIYAIPTVLMDGHVLKTSGSLDNAVQQAVVAIDQVRDAGGVACLDWHTESACDTFAYAGHRQALERILLHLQSRDDAWITTPWELTKHWHTRRRALATEEAS